MISVLYESLGNTLFKISFRIRFLYSIKCMTWNILTYHVSVLAERHWQYGWVQFSVFKKKKKNLLRNLDYDFCENFYLFYVRYLATVQERNIFFHRSVSCNSKFFCISNIFFVLQTKKIQLQISNKTLCLCLYIHKKS